MLEESLLKTNFVGRDGFRWWIGQVAPDAAQDLQNDGGGWGNRFKVRIMGYHPFSDKELPNEDLPWANVLLSPTDGSGAGQRAKSVRLSPGDNVFGFFLDGDNAQVPVITGVFGRTAVVSTQEYSSPFTPFTGYTSKVKNDGKNIVQNQTNEQNSQSQKTPKSVSPQDAKKLSSDGQAPDKGERAAFDGVGDKVLAATGSGASAVSKIKVEVENFVNKVRSITDNVTGAVGKAKKFLNSEIGKVTASIQKNASGLVNNMTKNLFTAMEPVLNSGLKLLYKTVYALVFAATQSDKIAHLAGVAAQRSMIVPVKKLADALPCIANSIIKGIGDTIKGVISNVAENVTNFVSCIGDQVVGALMNHIIGGITNFMGPLLGGVGKILQGFTPLNWLRNTASSILELADSLSCEEVSPEFNSPTNEWVIGKGGSDNTGVPVQDILDQANEANSIASLAVNTLQDISELGGSLGVFDFMNPSVSQPGFESALGKCYAGPPQLGGCGGTKIKIFGGFGEGGTANAIIGAIKQVSNGGRGITGSVIGVDLVNGGGGYTFPPFVEIVDECKSGYGAVARSEIDYETGEITNIYLLSEGEGYTPSQDQGDYINDLPEIIDPGIGYESVDRVIDNNGNEYSIDVDFDGRIIRLKPEGVDGNPDLEFKPITDAVEFDIRTSTGFGARLKPKFRIRPEGTQGTVKQVIDCISKDDDLVGYVNGEPYYGPFHIHPTNGRKMIGATHTSAPHQYIYDTQAESLGSSSGTVRTTTQIQQVAGGGASATTSATTPTPAPTPTPPPSSPTPTPPPSSSPPPSPPPSSGGGSSSSGGY